MTNTLHRKGTEESLRQDFVVFAMAKGDIPDLANKLNRFTQICLKHKPVNMSRIEDGVPRRINLRRIDQEMQNRVGHSATFDNVSALAAVITELKEADLGISINVSGLLEEVNRCCQKTGLQRHSTEHSLGVFGKTRMLPPWPIVEINSMCGHGLVSFNLIKKVVDEVKTERMTPEEGAYQLAKPCECGAFNPTRAQQFLEKLRMLG
jgi:hypothetical protein